MKSRTKSTNYDFIKSSLESLILEIDDDCNVMIAVFLLKQEIEKLREAIVTLLQDLTSSQIQLSETQARLDAMVYCLGQEAAEHRITKDLLNQCIQDRIRE
jgi:hypothetical protein